MATSVDAKLLKQTKFPAEFSQKVDMQKVNVEVMKKWIAGKISEILGNEDDVVIELCFNLLEGARFPDIKVLQIQLTGFLDKDTARFCKELWTLCLSAQSNPQGVPKELLEAKKLELIQEKRKKFGVERNKKSYGIGTLITYASVNEVNEVEAVVEGVEEFRIMTVVHLDTQDLRHPGVVVPLIEMITEGRHQGVRSIHIFLGVVGDVIQTIGDVAHVVSHILPLVLLRAPSPHQGDEEGTRMSSSDHDVDLILQ
ncbi:MAG: hypothetical protein Q9187_001994 [Circinaria calcarea]